MYRKKNYKNYKNLQLLPNSSGLTIFAIIDLAVMKIVPPMMSTNGPEINNTFTLSIFFYHFITMVLYYYISKCYLSFEFRLVLIGTVNECRIVCKQ